MSGWIEGIPDTAGLARRRIQLRVVDRLCIGLVRARHRSTIGLMMTRSRGFIIIVLVVSVYFRLAFELFKNNEICLILRFSEVELPPIIIVILERGSSSISCKARVTTITYRCAKYELVLIARIGLDQHLLSQWRGLVSLVLEDRWLLKSASP